MLRKVAASYSHKSADSAFTLTRDPPVPIPIPVPVFGVELKLPFPRPQPTTAALSELAVINPVLVLRPEFPPLYRKLEKLYTETETTG